jgi:hypothetical protein
MLQPRSEATRRICQRQFIVSYDLGHTALAPRYKTPTLRLGFRFRGQTYCAQSELFRFDPCRILPNLVLMRGYIIDLA